MNHQNFLNFFEFIYDRHSIWVKRNKNENPPWSNDNTLATYHFCNVNRRLDKGTQHLIKYIIKPNMPMNKKVFNIILYRRFNVYNFFKDIVPPINAKDFNFKYLENLFDFKKSQGYKLFSEAYMLSQISFTSKYRKSDKHIQTLLSMEKVAENIDWFTKDIQEANSPERIHEIIQHIKLVGPFLAYQILTDLTYIPGFIKHDMNSFVHVGPGAVGGLELIYGYMKPQHRQIMCMDLFYKQEEGFAKLKKDRKKDWNNLSPELLCLSNIQSCLCEFRKYNNLKTNPRSRKRYYKGAGNELQRKKSKGSNQGVLF